MRRSFAAACLPLVVGLAACATGTPSGELDPLSAEVDANPVAAGIRAGSEAIPLAWFADNWGPFDASLVGNVGPGPGGRPLLIQDGVQVGELTEMRGDVFAALTDPAGDGGFSAVRVFKHPCDTRHFGAAGVVGVIMVFSMDYEGPLPGRGHRWDGGPCDGGGP